MSKTHLLIFVIGIAGLTLLSVMMKQALKIHKDRNVHPLATEIARHFGPRLDGDLNIKVATTPTKQLSVTVQPLLGINPRRLANEVGEFVWYRVGRDGVTGVTVVVHDVLDQTDRRFEIERPLLADLPTPASTSRPTRAAGVPGK